MSHDSPRRKNKHQLQTDAGEYRSPLAALQRTAYDRNTASPTQQAVWKPTKQIKLEDGVLPPPVLVHWSEMEKFSLNTAALGNQLDLIQPSQSQQYEDILLDKDETITKMKAVVADLEMQNNRLRSLRRGGVDSPVMQCDSNKVDVKLNVKEMMKSRVGTPTTTPQRTPFVDSPAFNAVDTSVSYIALVEQIQKLQGDKFDLCRQLDSFRSFNGSTEEQSIVQPAKEYLLKLRNRPQQKRDSIHSTESTPVQTLQRSSVVDMKVFGERQKEIGDLNQSLEDLKNEKNLLLSQLQLTTMNLDKVTIQLQDALAQLSNERHAQENNEKYIRGLQAELKDTCLKLTNSELETTELRLQLRQCENRVQFLEQQMKEEVLILVDAKNSVESELRTVQERLKLIGGQLIMTVRTLKDEINRLRPEMISLINDTNYECIRNSLQIVTAVENTKLYNAVLIAKYQREILLRKRYYNQLVELKGNIRVMCRSRPVIEEDLRGYEGAPQMVLSFDPVDEGLIKVMHKGRLQNFEYDLVFGSNSTQTSVFNAVQDVVLSCIDGFNVSVFAYGQTGSGKTFTMEGIPSDLGINQRALFMLFNEMEQRRPDWTYQLNLCMLEIYNETIRDLLSSEPGAGGKLEVKMASGGGLHVPGLTWVTVDSISEINQMFALGQHRRTTASTNMNNSSSRSHAVLCVNIKGTSSLTGVTTMGKLSLVDLAGSERVSKSGAEGDRLTEAKSINKSLSALGDVIHALRARQSFVPYRNSVLTYLLQDSLGGDGKTIVIAQVSPVEKNVDETMATLAFAQRVRSVELGEATRKTTETPTTTPRR